MLFMLVASAILSVIIHVMLIQPLSGRSMLADIMVTIALSIVLRAAIEIIYGPQGRTLATPLPSGVIQIGQLRISQLHLTAALVSWACMGVFGAFFRYTSVGLLMRGLGEQFGPHPRRQSNAERTQQTAHLAAQGSLDPDELIAGAEQRLDLMAVDRLDVDGREPARA